MKEGFHGRRPHAAAALIPPAALTPFPHAAAHAPPSATNPPKPQTLALSGERTPEGFFAVRGGIDAAIARALAYAPHADLLWFETDKPDLAQAEAFAKVRGGWGGGLGVRRALAPLSLPSSSQRREPRLSGFSLCLLSPLPLHPHHAALSQPSCRR